MEFLRSTKLEKYSECFENNGYDDLDFIENKTKVQLIDMLRTVGIHEKPGHILKLFAAFSILKYKKKHGVPNQVDCEKEEPKSLKEIWAKNVQKL